jgi:2-dehydro-3-deoxygluconokinase
MTPRVDFIALGEGMVEFNQAEGAHSNVFVRGSGGDTSNAAIAAARLGRDLASPVRVAYLTRVGQDAFGTQLLELWRTEGIDIGGVEVDPDAPTGVYFVTHDAQGHAFSYLRAGSAASRMQPCDRHDTWIATSRVLHVSGISQAISTSACDAVLAAVDVARAHGVHVSYDPNLRLRLWPLARARAVIMSTLARCDVFLPSLDEARTLSGLHAPEAIVAWAHGHGAPIVALKCGEDGVLASDGTRAEMIRGQRVKSVDATGAGDCFDGAFNVRLLAGDDVFTAARYANAAAALATTGFGAVAPLPRDADVRALLDG